jgi:hypothetical protein
MGQAPHNGRDDLLDGALHLEVDDRIPVVAEQVDEELIAVLVEVRSALGGSGLPVELHWCGDE